MPLARATLGSLKLGFCFTKNQALRIPIAIFFVLGVNLVFWWFIFLLGVIFLWDYFFNWDIFLVELFYRRCLYC